MEKDNICGVYKITSPTEKVYIGESKNIQRRWNDYKKLRCKTQVKIYNSFIKYGWENHIFEIIEECGVEELKCRERYWQDFYDVLGRSGLNLKLTECGEVKQEHSEETIEKIRNSRLGKKLSQEHRDNIGRGVKGEKNYLFGKKGVLCSFSKKIIDVYTKDVYIGQQECADRLLVKREAISYHLKKFSYAYKNLMYYEDYLELLKEIPHEIIVENILNMLPKERGGDNSPWKGKKLSEEHKAKISKTKRSNIGDECANPTNKKVINTVTQEIICSCRILSDKLNINYSSLRGMLNYSLVNKTEWMYLIDYIKLNPDFKHD